MRPFSVGFAVLSFVIVGLASSANAAPVLFSANLTGPNESPPNASPATGTALVTMDLALNTMRVQVDFSGLTGGDTASHIHCCTGSPLTATAGVATVTPTFTGFPGGVTSGTYDHTFDMLLASSYNSAFINGSFDPTHDPAGAELALYNAMFLGEAYLNIHTSNFPSGEIRGFLLPVSVPEPLTISLFGAGLVGAVAMRRKKARQG